MVVCDMNAKVGREHIYRLVIVPNKKIYTNSLLNLLMEGTYIGANWVIVYFKPQTMIIEDDTGTIITEEKQVINHFKENFEDLNRPTVETKFNKVSRENSIVVELLKKGGTILLSKTREVIRQYEKLRLSRENGKLQLGISLLNTCYKNLTTLILERINPFVEEIVGNYQCGFKREKSTVDHVFALRQIMSKYYEFGKDLNLVFVDYKQTYNNVDREDLWKILSILEKKKIYELNKSMLWKNIMQIKSGLKQGDALSPALLNLALEKIIRDTDDDRRMEISNE
ncbi:hypothetical protein AGLY_016307 [Aphis glycines]|uniref:Reverse transcriptase domain-containing protein n=1 Tax=Aphis glycines TaxID=307491 RepID=A0A6G0SYF6_APHGL|nr:hypothetical protein AGLY_016307 [Aphis glycines]